jgi:sugar O-acyltransferase (sialic acid O-acetyltransferase NeuD family)
MDSPAVTDLKGRQVTLFGVSNMLSDIFEAIDALGGRLARVVVNQPEAVRPRTMSFHDRFAGLGVAPEIVAWDAFAPQAGDLFALGTTAAGRDKLIADVAGRWRLTMCAIVHPTAHVSRFVALAPGVFVGAQSVIAPGAQLETGAFVNRGVTVGHDTRLGAACRLMPGSNVGGHVRLGARATIGMGASVIEELEIGDDAFVAAGAVVVRDVGAGVRVAGVPAKPLDR